MRPAARGREGDGKDQEECSGERRGEKMSESREEVEEEKAK